MHAMFNPRLLKYARLLLPPMTWELPDRGCVYLTFDDGPTPGVTPRVLDILAAAEVKATFFCLGKNVEQHPGLYRAIVEAGHKVGNHSYSHVRGWGMPTEQYVEDVDLANQLVDSDIFRPPYGRIRRRQAEVLSSRYRLVMGGIISRDYNPKVSPQQCLRNVTGSVSGGSVVVFHDSAKAFRNMAYALPRAIEHIRSMGLGFDTIGAEAPRLSGPQREEMPRPGMTWLPEESIPGLGDDKRGLVALYGKTWKK